MAAADREQARVLLGYASAPFETSAELRGLVQRPSPWSRLAELVTRRTRWGLDLTTGVSVEVPTASYGSIRGRTYALVVADELAFWQREDGSNPASEVLTAVRPGLATLDGQLLVISTPFAKSGPLWDACDRYFGQDDDRVLVWRAPSRVMNPTIPERVVLDALERDEASARAEWLAEFRDDLSTFVSSERLRACVIPGRTGDLDTLHGADHLVAVDPATGAGQDSMTACVVHVEETEDGRLVVVVDALREWRPSFDPEAVTRECAVLCRAYDTDRVHGDRFAGGWTDAAFRRSGITYEPMPFSKSQAYVDFLRLVNARQVELPDSPRLLQQATGLQRRTGAQGRRNREAVLKWLGQVTPPVVKGDADAHVLVLDEDIREARAVVVDELVREAVARRQAPVEVEGLRLTPALVRDAMAAMVDEAVHQAMCRLTGRVD